MIPLVFVAARLSGVRRVCALAITFVVPMMLLASVPNVRGGLAPTQATGGGSWIANASVRARAGAGDRTLIAGFVISGEGTKPMLVRGIGPALLGLGIKSALPHPGIQLFDLTTRSLVASNRGWSEGSNGPEIAATTARLGGFPLATGSADSALLSPLAAGVYSANLSDADDEGGVALMELYDGDASSSARLVNLSARTQVGIDEDVLILGFVIGGSTSKQVLLRGVGPALAGFGVGSVLADPKLELRDGRGVLVDSNDNWGGSAAVVKAAEKVGAFALPAESRDACLLVTLPPGAYTVHVVGVGATTGVALAELYDVPMPEPETRWTMINVSPNGQQADCNLIQFPNGQTVLIDVADAADANGAALNYLRSHAITHVDLVVISHFHVDHYGRLRDLINAGVRVDQVAINMPAPNASIVNAEAPWGFSRADAEALLAFLREKGIPYFTPYSGQKLIEMPLGDGTWASLTALCLYDGTNSPVGQTDTNDTSIIVRLEHGRTRALFTGDLNESLGAWLAGSSFDLSADVLKVPHHGTEGCAPDAFFDRVNPKLALVPSPAGLWESPRSSRIRSYFESHHIPTYVSGIQGDVTVTMNAQGYRIGN